MDEYKAVSLINGKYINIIWHFPWSHSNVVFSQNEKINEKSTIGNLKICEQLLGQRKYYDVYYKIHSI